MPRALGISLLLAIAMLAVYAQVSGFEFVALDDDVYVTENERVSGGLTTGAVRWAFTTAHQGNWHPLTWLSHMLDCDLWGLDPSGHHLSNLALHIVNTWLLLAFLVAAGGRFWPAVVVAALFALHPINVESVAWVAQRKNVLSMTLGLGSAIAYTTYARRGGAWRYLLTALLLALGLMAKPMLVTLPLLFLLLDYWPLERTGRLPFGRLLIEKLPLLALSAASSAVTFALQSAGGAVAEAAHAVPFGLRLANAAVAYVRYLRKLIWPDDLAILYAHPDAHGGTPWSAWQVLSAIVVLLAISALVLRLSSRRYLCVGWLWYLVTLVPVIGLVQVGEQAMADRYAYLPAIGVFVAAVWGAGELLAAPAARRFVPGALVSAVVCAILIAFAFAVRHQTRYWRDSVPLLERGLVISPRSPTLHYNLGTVLVSRERFADAIEHFTRALEVGPGTANAHWGLASALQGAGRGDEAIAHYRKALSIEPGNAEVHLALGDAVRARGDVAGAVAHYERALEIDPFLVAAHNNLGTALLATGAADRAIRALSEAVKLDPLMPEAHNNLGAALMQRGRSAEALEHFREAARLRPDWYVPLGSAARILVTDREIAERSPGEAVPLARRASELAGHRDAWILDTLAMAFAQEGRLAEAVRTAEVALNVATTTGRPALADEIRVRLVSYRREEQ